MKASAEYFRDLAHDDRYFGAEPPAPDAEMLAKIAEREISRRVETQMDGKGIRLRAAIDDDAPAQDTVAMPPKAQAPARDESPSSLMPSAPLMAATVEADPVVEATIPEAPAVEDEAFAPAPPAHPDAESVAAKLQRIRAVVGKPPASAEETFDDSGLVEEPAEVDAVVAAEDIIADVADDVAEVEIVEDVSEIEITEVEAEVEANEIEETDDVVETNVTETETDAEKATEVELSSDLNDIDVPEIAEAAPVEAPKPAVRARIVRLRKDKPAEVVAAPIEASSVDDDSDVAQRVAAALKVDSPQAEAADDVIEDAISEVEIPMVAEADVAEIIAEEIEAVEPETTESVADLEVDQTIAADIADADDHADQQDFGNDEIRAAVAAALPVGQLSDDDEDDLQRELAAVAEDVVSIDDAAPEIEEIVVEEVAEVAAEMPEVVEAPARAGREILPATDDAAMSRIMTQTDEALNEPTGSRRRNAIAQLKAAVAATEAARQLGDASDTVAKAQEPFREDLDQAVRPRRSVADEAQDLRSERPRTAPLKLVASQRVDEEEAASDSQPRRVASQPVESGEKGGFAQFAAQMGATELPDLLEAAAAYTSFVEGVEDFSRPQIMKKVQLTSDEEFSREDGLRSFGTLLRQGRISKVRNGRFQVSDQTRFRPDARSA
jgi:hypothetical protein